MPRPRLRSSGHCELSQFLLAHGRAESYGVAVDHHKVAITVLTSKQYEAIGRLTLAFNEIDQIVESYIPHMLGNPEPALCFAIAGRETFFNRKSELLRTILKAVLHDRPTIEREISAVLTLLDKSDALARQRNEYVHGFAFIDYTKRKRMLRTKKALIEIDEVKITALANDADDLSVPLSQALHKLQMSLMKVRYQ